LPNTPSSIDLEVSLNLRFVLGQKLIMEDDLKILDIISRTPSPGPSPEPEPEPELARQPESTINNDALNTIRLMLEQVCEVSTGFSLKMNLNGF
jgi:hypothetical protein